MFELVEEEGAEPAREDAAGRLTGPRGRNASDNRVVLSLRQFFRSGEARQEGAIATGNSRIPWWPGKVYRHGDCTLVAACLSAVLRLPR